MSVDQQAIAAAYLANTNLKIADLAATHELKVADVAAILRLNGVAIRRGNPNGVSEEGRAKGRATRQAKALRTTIYKLREVHGKDVIVAILNEEPENDATSE